MNIVAILANGVGNRFESNVPKQFHKICDKMIIEYVIEAVKNSILTDRLIIATNLKDFSSYINELKDKYDADFINGGDTRNKTLKNVVDFIDNNYECDRLIVCDAVRPLITSGLIDDYFKSLSDCEAIVTAQKITDSLGSYDSHEVDREKYYLMQSPEGFNFKLLKEHFNPDSGLTEVTQQLPAETNIKLNFSFTNNIKVTYPADLKYIEVFIKERSINLDFVDIFNSIERFKKYLEREYPSKIDLWIESIQNGLPELMKKWKIDYCNVLNDSHFGIVIFANSLKYGKCVIKIIPTFINRYLQERACYQNLSSSFMCNLIDYDDELGVLLLDECDKSQEVIFNKDNKLLFDFFENVKKYSRLYNDIDGSEDFHNYSEILHDKINQDSIEYKKEVILNHVKNAVDIFDCTFSEKEYALIHGDLHRHNILKKGEKLIGIDPIGFLAPVEIDVARYIGTELTDSQGDKSELFNQMIDSFSFFSSKERLIKACYIDMVFRMHNSLFENENYTLTDKWIEIIDSLFNK